MPAPLDLVRYTFAGNPASAQPSPAARQRPPSAPLNVDVLCHVFDYLDGRDMPQVARVNQLWHAASAVRPLAKPWYQASNKVMQDFVRNRQRSVDLFRPEFVAQHAILTSLLHQQTAIGFDDVNEGLNESRMTQAFAAMPALRHLRLARNERASCKSAAVTWVRRPPVIHDRVRRQSVPPDLWQGALPATLTSVDLSGFSLCCAEESAGRYVLEPLLIDGLVQSIATHQNLTHLTLGSVFTDTLRLPQQLTHLTLTHPVRVRQGFVPRSMATPLLLGQLPQKLTCLVARDALNLASVSQCAAVPACIKRLAHLSLHVSHDDIETLNRWMQQATLVSLSLSCKLALSPTVALRQLGYPDTLKTLRLDVVHDADALRACLLEKLPVSLEGLRVDAQSVADVLAYADRLTPLTRLRHARFVLHTPPSADELDTLLARLPPGCTHIVVQGANSAARKALQPWLLQRPICRAALG